MSPLSSLCFLSSCVFPGGFLGGGGGVWKSRLALVVLVVRTWLYGRKDSRGVDHDEAVVV
jgi:hypothetical protein